MRLIVRAYDAALYGLAFVAGLLMVAMMTTIFIDVVLRNLGYQSSAHFFTFTEYALLLMPCMGAPWLVRERGHIYIEILLMHMGEAARRRFTVGIAVACIAVCAVVAWYGFEVAFTDFVQNEKDVRSFDMPRWMISVWIPVSFLMMAIEFGRFLWRRENFLAPLSELSGSS
ncbi:MAG TPA: TRAP transporter small permease [Burkholderiales bacterium]|nr:TRAP transporter small permease [Burkholderiales bacterium]